MEMGPPRGSPSDDVTCGGRLLPRGCSTGTRAQLIGRTVVGLDDCGKSACPLGSIVEWPIGEHRCRRTPSASGRSNQSDNRDREKLLILRNEIDQPPTDNTGRLRARCVPLSWCVPQDSSNRIQDIALFNGPTELVGLCADL